MNKITYNERVQAIAEKMAKKDYNSSYKVYVKYTTTHADNSSWSANFYRQLWPALISRYLPYAHIAVAEMAEAARSVFSYIDDPGIDPISDVNNYLKEQGLIPDDGQEAGSDDTK